MKAAKECSIFLIDDDRLSLQLLTGIIGSLNLVPQIKTFTRAQDALQHISDHARTPSQLPDYIFLDINMPEMDGWQFLTSLGILRNSLGKKPVIYMLSSSDDEQDMQMIKHFPDVRRYLTKPARRNELAAAFR